MSGGPKVLIVGAGFAGLQCARRLAGKPVDVTLVDRNNYHLFTPLLYQVASSLLDPSDIAYPVRSAIRGAANVRFRVGEVKSIDLDRRVAHLAEGDEVAYDYLVLAVGSVTNHFGLSNVQAVSHGLKDLPEALALRNHILRCLEAATVESDANKRRACLTFVVVGGGPTGVEYAGALSELVRLMLRREYPEIDATEVRILLVELTNSVLAAFSPPLGAHAAEELRRRGIEVRFGARVTDASEEHVTLAGGERIASRTLVWAAGVKARDIHLRPEIARTRSGRIEVDEYLRIRGRADAFAVGDLASVVQDGQELPMVAPPAMQAGRYVAGAILRTLHGETLPPFRYRDKGAAATIGRNAGVLESGSLRLTGFLGWLGWLALHLYYLIGFRNRGAVLARWAWNYIFYDRPVRLILEAKRRNPPLPVGSLPPSSRTNTDTLRP